MAARVRLTEKMVRAADPAGAAATGQPAYPWRGWITRASAAGYARSGGAEMRVVQDHPAQAPVIRVALPLHPLLVDVEVGRLGRPEERRNLRGRGRGLVDDCRSMGPAGRCRTARPLG